MNRTRVALLAVVPLAAGLLVPAIASATAGARTGSCDGSAIAVTASRSQGATGHSNFVVRFENISGSTCTLTGYPGLDAVGPHAQVLAHARRTVRGFTGGSHHGVQTISVGPGRFASADVEWQNFSDNGHACTTSLSVNATPAGTGYTVHIAQPVTVCKLQVHPTVAGRSGNS